MKMGGMRVEKDAEGFGDVQFVLERGKERAGNQAMIRSPHFRLRGSTDALLPSLRFREEGTGTPPRWSKEVPSRLRQARQ